MRRRADMSTLSRIVGHPYAAQDNKPIAIAHRGGALEAPENTMEAFRYAVDLGFHYLETDAQLTKDGVPVAFHDPSLNRVSDTTGNIGDLTLEELAEVRIADGGRISSIAALLETFPHCNFNIDAKSDAVLEPLLDVIAEHDALDRVCVASFFDHRIRKVRERFGAAAFTSCGPLELTVMMARSLAGSSSAGPCAAQVPRELWKIPIVTERFIDVAHRSGRQVHVWTIDDERVMHDLFDLGVDGIMTDRPSLLKQVMIDRGIW